MKKKIKKLLCVIISVSCLIISNISLISYAAYKTPFDLECKGCYLFNVDTGTVLYEKNKDLKLEPASLVKVMTAIIALEKIKDIDNTTVTAKGYIFDYLYGLNGTTAGIVKGETLTIRQLLECMLTQSACEAAMMIADAVCPDDIEGFVTLMNNKAKTLGAKNTNFTNPHGLHDDQEYSTAYDMFLITKHAMELPAFMDIVSRTSHQIPATNKRDSFEVYTTIDPMKKSSKYYYPPIRGIKTGTEEAGRSFVSSASKDGFTYICCVLCAPYRDEKTGKVISGNKAFEETIKLYDWVFDNFNLKTVMMADTPTAEVKLKYVMNKDHLKLTTEKNIIALIPKETDISSVKTTYNLPEEVLAPIKKGDLIGTAKLTLDGADISECNLISFETVKRNWFLYSLDIIKKVFDFIVFKVIGIILIICLIIFVLIFIIRIKNQKNQSRRKSRKNNIFR